MLEGSHPGDPLSPEYWNGHSFEDGCPQRLFIYAKPPFSDYESQEIARQLILESTAMWPLTVPTRTYAPGEEFDPSSVAPGTVLNMSREHLRRHKKGLSHLHGDYWAVVMNTSGDSSERVIYRISSEDVSAGRANGLILVEPHPVIIIGEVFHSSKDMLERINRLSIAWAGKGVRRELFPGAVKAQGQLADQKI